MQAGIQAEPAGFAISFALSHHPQSFRLLELPDELVDLVASHPRPQLCLKSAIASTLGNRNGPVLTPTTKMTEYVHLCSDDLLRSWSLRQVSTSNEVYIVQAIEHADGRQRTEAVDVTSNEVVLAAISKTDSLLELLPASIDSETHLRRLLPVYDQEQLARIFAQGGQAVLKEDEMEKGYAEIVHQIPAPDMLVRKKLQELCVCGYTRSGLDLQKQWFIPDLQLLLSAWNSAMVTYSIRTGGKGKIEKNDFEDDNDNASELLVVKHALSERLRSKDGAGVLKEETVIWVVRTLWQHLWESSAVEGRKAHPRLEIEESWRNALPQEFGPDASADKLEVGSYKLFEEGEEEMIRWTGGSKALPVAQAAAHALTNPGKRKWHDKFRDAKNAKP